MSIVLSFPQVCVGWGSQHKIHSVGYWNDFLVPTLFRCQVDFSFAVSCNYFCIALGFFVYLAYVKFDLF